MNPGAKSAAATGQAGAICLILLWAIWKFGGVDVPQEVAISFVIAFSPIVHGFMTWVERRIGVDIVPNGEPKTIEAKP